MFKTKCAIGLLLCIYNQVKTGLCAVKNKLTVSIAVKKLSSSQVLLIRCT